MDLNEIKSMIETQGTAWEQFKRTNDQIIAAKADGKAFADLEVKLATLGTAMDAASERQKALEADITRLNRPDLGTDKPDVALALSTKRFNDARRSLATNYVPDIDAKTYSLYKSGYWNWLRKGNLAALTPDEQKAMIAGDDSQGGYMLPEESTGRISARIFELSPIRQLASVQAISTAAMEGIYDNDESSYGWVAETGARTDTTTPTVGKYRIEAHEMYAAPKASQTLLDDSAVDIESWLAAKVADKFARVEGATFCTGTGVGQPRGFGSYTTAATADASRTWGQIEHVVTGANGAFHTTQGDPLFTLLQAFKTGYLSGASWVTTREVVGAIRKFKTTTTLDYIWQPGLQMGTPDRLLGYPLVLAQDLPALSTYATLASPMWLANWREAYQIVDRMGIRTLRDPFTSKPYVIFYSTARVGGACLNFEAIKCIKFTT